MKIKFNRNDCVIRIAVMLNVECLDVQGLINSNPHSYLNPKLPDSGSCQISHDIYSILIYQDRILVF